MRHAEKNHPASCPWKRLTRTCRVVVLSVPLAALVACQSAGSSFWDTAPAQVAVIRVQSIARGGAVKVNGMLAATLPGEVRLEVDETGKVVRPYVISLSTNILSASGSGSGRDLGSVEIAAGEVAPARIYFGDQGPQLTGQAIIQPGR